MTAFIHERVELDANLWVTIDGNSKITATNGSYAAPRPNAFSLPAASVDGSSYCPGSTESCRASCYVRGLAKHAPDVYEAYYANAFALTAILGADDLRRALYATRLGAWIEANAAGGFRWHVSGDVWHVRHAAWISDVCRASPNVRHWIYTRTLRAVPTLMLTPNLAVNVSADRDNYPDARHTSLLYGARMTYLATSRDDWPEDLPANAIVFPDYPLRGRALMVPTSHPWWRALPIARQRQVCPADFFGQSEAHRCGPCDRCMRLE